jgi:hypothetical protein
MNETEHDETLEEAAGGAGSPPETTEPDAPQDPVERASGTGPASSSGPGGTTGEGAWHVGGESDVIAERSGGSAERRGAPHTPDFGGTEESGEQEDESDMPNAEPEVGPAS